MQTEIIKINYETEQPTVSARELYRNLEVKYDFKRWTDVNFKDFGESIDYFRGHMAVRSNRYGGTQEIEDYFLTVDMAKHLCLMSKTDKGKQCRQYLIDLEKAWNTPEQIMARALKIADSTIIKLKAMNDALEDEVSRMHPKEVFADAVSASDSSMPVRDVAKMIRQNGVHLGEKRFYKWLRENGYICRNSTSPTQKAMEMGLFEIVVRTIERGDGLPLETKTTKVTGKGQQYFINKFLA